MKINQIWEELENDQTFNRGMLLRRYSGSILPDLFIALKLPERYRCLAASINNSISIDISTFTNLKDIGVELIPDSNNPNKNTLVFKLISSQHKDIFSVLCEDLIESIANVSDEKLFVKELLNRFEKWKSLFDKTSSPGLTPEEQRGLFGELYFIRKFLNSNSDKLKIINSWVGCEKQIRDFQFGNWSVEVKTTQGNNHQKVHISSERQLDKNHLEFLFLFYASLETRQQSGENLNQIVDDILNKVKDDFITYNRFKSKLLEGGYFEIHKHLYENTGYIIRQEAFYKVENEFPRIEESEIRSGVGDVEYTIILSQCSDYIIDEETIFKTINFNEQ